MLDDDDFLDELFEYDMVMNDGEWFFGKDKDKSKSSEGHGKQGAEPSGCGCLTVCIVAFIIWAIIFS